MDHSELPSAKVQSALSPLGFWFSCKTEMPFFLRSKKDFWIASDQIENYGTFIAVQQNLSFQTVLTIVLGKKTHNFPPLFFKKHDLHKKHLNNNSKIPSFLNARNANKCKAYVTHLFTIPTSRTFHKLKRRKKRSYVKEVNFFNLHSCLLQTSLDKAACVAAFLYELVHNISLVLHGKEHATANKINIAVDQEITHTQATDDPSKCFCDFDSVLSRCKNGIHQELQAPVFIEQVSGIYQLHNCQVPSA